VANFFDRLFDFIDRKKERDIFKKILNREVDERILTLLINAKCGKTYLMKFFLKYCQDENNTPVALVDFDTRDSGPITFWKFTDQICEQWGWQNFETVSKTKNLFGEFGPSVSIHTGGGETKGVDFGSKGQFQQANVEQITGRDNIQTGNITISETKEAVALRQELLMDELGRALRTDLANFCNPNRVVLLLDTYEHISIETHRWIDEWIFSPIQEKYPHLIIVMAGRPEEHMRRYVEVAERSWHTPMHVSDDYDPCDENDVSQYAELWNLELGGEQLQVFMTAAKHKISLLGELRDAYRRQAYE